MDAILPPDTRVRITGNNRTKSQLFNLQGRVLTAQTLGGWHEVDLEAGGGVVRVQRNALEVLEYPRLPAHQDPSADREKDEIAAPGASTTGSAAAAHDKDDPARRLHHSSHSASRRLAPKLNKKMKPKTSSSGGGGAGNHQHLHQQPHQPAKFYANIARLETASLSRYRRAYNLPVSNDCSRDELVYAVRRHFMKIKVHNEADVIISSLKRLAAGASTPSD